MKRKITAWTLIGVLTGLAVFFMVSCASDPVATVQTTNRDIKVDLLFVHDGCSVYRFNDGGDFIYYTVCDANRPADTSWDQHKGKTVYPMQVQTVQR